MDFEQLPPERALPPERRVAMRELLTAEVAKATREPWWRRSRRAATIGTGAFALVLAGGAASATYVVFQPATDVHSVWCYASNSLDGDTQRVQAAKANEVVVPPGTSADDAETIMSEEAAGAVEVDDPVGLCDQVWKDGVLTTRDPGTVDPSDARVEDVPDELTACTLRDGIAAVFPGDEGVCTELSLPRLTQ